MRPSDIRSSNFRPNFPANFRPYRPPDPPPRWSSRPANFVIELLCDPNSATPCGRRKAVVEGLIGECKYAPDIRVIFDSGSIAGRLFFTQWSCALEAMVGIWGSRFSRSHSFVPKLIHNVVVPSDVDELNDRLKVLFVEKIKGLVSGELVNRWEKKLQGVEGEVAGVDAALKKHNSVLKFEELNDKKKVLMSEKELILKRIGEFKDGMECILRHIKGGRCSGDKENKGWVPALRLRNAVDWDTVYCLVTRECRRLDDGLPIYAFRQEIIQRISSQQILVLIGETGSGKSTQLVQFLADSGVVGSGTVVCTQPRKIAAISLAQRVQEESNGCYEHGAISFRPSYFSQQFKDRIVYMTDHCLLQHCMNDRNMHGVSCILVDEAHERSLNTDLLLALLKSVLPPRRDLRLIIMSATADAKQLSDYFFECGMFAVVGRNYPVDVKHIPCLSEGISQLCVSSPANVAPYVSDVVRAVAEIHRTEEEGTILAFLTSPLEVEWACESFQAPNARPLALHGKLSYEEQSLVFQDYPGKRKVIFATNVAETSLTIPGVKYVVDSGLAKESRFEPGSGMNILRVCWISKSSANQRAGRAGRTEPGRCYRLYSHDDFCSMTDQQEPEIRRVHLGVAVLKIIALGVKNVQEFDFVDAPSLKAIDMAIQNLMQLGAISKVNGDIELTVTGRCLVKLGIEPRLGKLVLDCFREHLGREGLALAAVMANSSSIFCRVGNHADKLKSDCLKVPFCHRDGDLFTLLSVYKAWLNVPLLKRNRWCWDNSINAKSMRRCHETIFELEYCLKSELHMIVPTYWLWRPEETTEHDKKLKKAILAALAENVAIYSGSDQLGYNVALTGQHVQLHPGCSLLMFNRKPDWVVFGEILSASDQYLVCATAVDEEFLSTLNPPPRFDAFEVKMQKLQMTILSGFGKTLLKKFCGKSNNGLLCLLSRIRKICSEDRIFIEVDVDNNEIRLFSPPRDVEKGLSYVKHALDCERRWMQNECMELCLYYGGPGTSPPVALFGSGAEIKHLEIDKRSLTVDVFASKVSTIDDKELILFVEDYATGICALHKSAAYGRETEEREKWGSITFLTPDAAERAAAKLNNIEFNGSLLEVNLSGTTYGVDRAFSFPAVKAKVSWPRRFSKGLAIVKCDLREVGLMVLHFSNLQIGERYVRCEASTKYSDSVVISGIDREASEHEVLHALRNATTCRILDFFLVRGDAVDNPPCRACEEALFREISVFMPKGSPQINFCRVQVFSPEPKDVFMRALITFDGRLHLEAAKALEQIEGKVLPGFRSWQKIQCQRLFQTSLSCPSSIYAVIEREVDSLVLRCNRRKGIECTVHRNANGSCRVRISATATKTVAELRRPFEELMKGRTITNPSLTPSVLQLLFSRDGVTLMKSIHREMGVYVLFDKQSLNVRLFGPSNKIFTAEETFVQRLLSLHENKQLEVNLRGATLPHDLMKEVVKRFGPDLHGLRTKVPEAEFSLHTRRQVISISGTKEAKQKVEEIVNEIAQARRGASTDITDAETACPICLCEVEEQYQLEGCMHVFCRSCLVEQCESAIKNIDIFPICCAHEGCGVPFWLVDLKSLLPGEKLEELFAASVKAFVASSGGSYRFCPSPDCPSVYRVVGPRKPGEPFVCGACYAETCTKCHLEYHPFLSCEKYKEYKEDPDSSLKEWWKGKEEHVKGCPDCGYTIEKAEGCNHVECKCGSHICWVCLDHFLTSDDCYNHLRAIHHGIT